jgi:hypothetical protein
MGSLPNTERGLYKKIDEQKNYLDIATAENNQLKKSLDEQKKSLDNATAENNQLKKSLDEQKKSLDNATAENNQLRYYLDNVIAENNTVKTELDQLKYPDSNNPEIQAKRAGNVPYIKPKDMYAQIDSIELDTRKLDPRLEYVATLVRKEPFFSGNTTNFFYKFHVTPPPDEIKFTTEWRQNRQVEIPFPAVLFLRCQNDEKKNKLRIHGIYVITQETEVKKKNMPDEAELIGIVKLEKKKDFYERDERDSKPVTRIDGKILHFDLKIMGHLTNMVFPRPNEHEVDNLDRAIIDEKKSNIGQQISNYYLTRFHVYDLRTQTAYNMLKKVTMTSEDLEKKKDVSTTPPPSNTPSSKFDISKGVANAAIGASKFITESLVGSGKRRRNVKYKTKKMKYKKYKKKNNRKTRVKME